MLSFDRLMVLAPHADDESLGCGGLLARYPGAFLVLVSNGDVVLHHGTSVQRQVKAQERVEEFTAAAERLAATPLLLGFQTRCLSNQHGLLVSALESVINAHQPDCLLIPGRSFHDDHVAVYRAAVAALRPGHCRSIRAVLCYETPYYVWAADEDRFEPNVYLPLSSVEVENKLGLCSLYRSQRLDEPWAQTVIRNHLVRRGFEASLTSPVASTPLAEAYRLVRAIGDVSHV